METPLSPSDARKGAGFVSFLIGVLLLAVYIGGVALVLAVWLIEQKIGSSDAGTLAAIIGMALSVVFLMALVVNIVGLILGVVAVLHPKVAKERRFAAAGIAINMLPPLLYCLLILQLVVFPP